MTDVFDIINVIKTTESCDCIICHYYYVLKINFIFQWNLYVYHDLMQKAISFNDVAIMSVKGSAYRIHFLHRFVFCIFSKNEALN